jgi:hypothetical protein
VIRRGCPEWRGDLAIRALGLPAPEVDEPLDSHLAVCAACSRELEELLAAADALALAEVQHLDRPETPPSLADQIVERVAEEAAAARRGRRRRLAAAVTAVAAAIVVAIAVIASSLGGGATATPVELAGDDGVSGTAILTPRAWGTEVTLDVSGLDEGEVYWLWLTDEDGDRVVAGSLTGTSGPARAVLASALPTAEARRIWMTDDADQVVLDASIAEGSLPGR